MPEVFLISSSVGLALIGIALAWQHDHASKTAVIRGDIDAIHRLCLRDARRQGRTIAPTRATEVSSLAKRLSVLPLESLVRLGDIALASDHPFAPDLFAAVFERLDQMRSTAQLDEERRSHWPTLRDFFSHASAPVTLRAE